MFFGMIFLDFFAIVMKMCSPPSVGSTFPKADFCQHRVQGEVSVHKMASKPSLWEGRFRLVLLLKPYVLPTERKRAPPGKLCLASLVSRMHFGWDFSYFRSCLS